MEINSAPQIKIKYNSIKMNGIMSRLFYLPDEREVELDIAETILQASLRVGIAHAHACGGNARCSTCRVLILEGLEHCAPRNAKEGELVERLHFSPEIRLACQTTAISYVKLRRLVLDAEDVELTSQLNVEITFDSVGKEKRIAILFADIRGFTAFAEALPPYDVIYVLNRYFHQMDRVINSHGGYIDNYMGDGLMALFGVEDPAGAALRAVKAGLEMLEAVARFKPYLESVYAKSFQIGIGLHYGEAVVGTIGRLKRLTAIGDAVNLASRIEAANKEEDTRFLISEDTYALVRDRVRIGRCVHLNLPGKSGFYNLYEIIGTNDPNLIEYKTNNL